MTLGQHTEPQGTARMESTTIEVDADGAAAGAAAPVDAAFPPGDYAIVEIMGYQMLIGRIAEVTRFGAAMLQIEPIFAGALLAPTLQGGAAIYRLTPCDAETAFARAPKETQRWALPDAIRATLPPALLPPPRSTDPSIIDESAFLGGEDQDDAAGDASDDWSDDAS